MDKINFLITEVSLECLGNKFFDIYGNQANSLLRLISVSSLQPQPTDADAQSELWKSLTVEKRRSKINRIKGMFRYNAWIRIDRTNYLASYGNFSFY